MAIDEKTKHEIEHIVRRNHITRSDIEIDLDTRDNYPGEFYLISLIGFSDAALRAYLEEMTEEK